MADNVHSYQQSGHTVTEIGIDKMPILITVSGDRRLKSATLSISRVPRSAVATSLDESAELEIAVVFRKSEEIAALLEALRATARELNWEID